MRTAVIDIGTNSARMLVAEVRGDEVDVIEKGLITTRLGQGIGTRPVLLEEAMERTLEALICFTKAVHKHKAERVIVTATSAVRDAENRNDFLNKAKAAVGWDIRVLSGEEEARMSYLGAVIGLQRELEKPVVIDIGGGSTEFIRTGEAGLDCTSLRLGAVRMTERSCCLEEISEMLAPQLSIIKNEGFGCLVGVGGTVTTLAAIDQQMEVYDPEKIHGYFLSRRNIFKILSTLEGMTLQQRQGVPGLLPQRADIIIAGIRIAAATAEGLGAEGILASETDIMYGLIYDLAGEHIFSRRGIYL